MLKVAFRPKGDVPSDLLNFPTLGLSQYAAFRERLDQAHARVRRRSLAPGKLHI